MSATYTAKPPISFFIVWNPAGNNPQHRHATIEKAREEARRLARSKPGEEFFVMEAHYSLKKLDVVETQFATHGEIPF